MVDPTGAISLGITVCQGLVWYYQGWSAWEDDVKSAVQDVEDVSKLLNILQGRLGKISADQADIVSQANIIAARLLGAVEQLEEIRDKCKAVPKEDGEKHRTRNFLRRSLYPFKQSTLQGLRDAVKRTRESLTDLLQLLQIDLVENEQQLRSSVDRALKQTLSANQSLAYIEPKIEEISNISQSAMRIESKANVLVDESKEVGRKVDVVNSNLEDLNTNIISTSQERAREFAELNDLLARIEMTQKTIVALATTRGSFFQEHKTTELPVMRRPRPHRSQLAHRLCSCRKRTDSYQSTYSVGWLHISSTTSNIFAHSRSCPYWNQSAESKSNELSAQYISSAFGKTLQLAMKITRGAGGLSISPLLTLRGFVRNDSPVFALFDYGTLLQHEYNLGEYMDYASTRMLQHFADGAGSPYDVNEEGETILHRILHIGLDPLVSETNVGNFRKLIFTCVDAGTPLNELDSNPFGRRTPLEMLITFSYDNWSLLTGIVSELYISGADLSDRFLGGPFFSLTFARHIDSWCEVTNCGPLNTAVIQQDEQKVSTLLSRSPEAIEELDCRGRSPMHLSSVWPRGIELLPQRSGPSLVNQLDNVGQPNHMRWLPMSYAFANYNFEAVKMLLDAGSALSSPAWMRLGPKKCSHEEILFRAFDARDSRFISLAVEALQGRRMQLYDMAREMLPRNIWAKLDIPTDRVLDKDAVRVQRALLDFNIEIPQTLQVKQNMTTLYHSFTKGEWRISLKSFGIAFITEVADSFFNAGFRDIDTSDEWGLTPLEFNCLYGNNLIDELALISWLSAKGVNLHHHSTGLDQSKHVSGITGLHMIGHLVGRCVSYRVNWECRSEFHSLDFNIRELQATVSGVLDSLEETSQILIRSSIQEHPVDSCLCGCSHSGCSPMIILLKCINGGWRRLLPCYILPLYERVVKWIENDSATDCSQRLPLLVATDIIRFGTFETLGLTHTCCNGCQEYYGGLDNEAFTPRFEASEIDEIREEEQCLLDEQERIVDELMQMYEQLEESLSSFLTGFWRTKMARWLTERHPVRDEDLVNMRRIGVVMDYSDEGGSADELVNLEKSEDDGDRLKDDTDYKEDTDADKQATSPPWVEDVQSDRREGSDSGENASGLESDRVHDSSQYHTSQDKQISAHDQHLEWRISDEEWIKILREFHVR